MDIENATATVLALVRHGEAENNRDGFIGGHTSCTLTELGQAQARAAGQVLASRLGPEAIIASDLPRAHQTGAAIAEITGAPLSLDSRLRERTLGELDGLPFGDAEARAPGLWKRLRARDATLEPPGGETLPALMLRMGAALDDIAKAHEGRRVVVVSHGLALFYALAHILGVRDVEHARGVFCLVDNCSISMVERRPRYWYIRSVNDISHLIDLAADIK